MADSPADHPFSAIHFLRTRSLTNVVQAEIERMIVDGELKPNERLNENALAQQLGVSRGPIREACSGLTAMGLLELVPNRGFFVRALTDAEAAELVEARAGILAYIALLLADKITSEQIGLLRGLLARMDTAAATGDAKLYYPLNLEFHDTLIRMCGNRRLEQMYRGLVRELHIHRYRGLQAGTALEVSNIEHKAIVDALEAREPGAVFARVRSHVHSCLQRNLDVRHARPVGADPHPWPPEDEDAPAEAASA
ncbi:MAG TPA: FCD domain-containing protein [Geminicoccaceae bacterium]|nr:FCD domain-containing protein [Geminicoccaceae bacterium]